MYYCDRWTQNINGQDMSGSTVRDIWQELRCDEITGDQTIYMNAVGDTQDHGDINNEICEQHQHQVDYVDDAYINAHQDLMNSGWMQCGVCEDNRVPIRDRQMFATQEDRDFHATETHRGGEPMMADTEGPPRPTNRLNPAQRAFIDAMPGGTPPPLEYHPPVGLPDAPIWPMPLDPTAPWHFEPPVPPEIRIEVEGYLINSYRTAYNRHPYGAFTGIRMNTDAPRPTFVMLRSESDLMGSLRTGWTAHRFMPGPERPVRSTTSMWEAIA